MLVSRVNFVIIIKIVVTVYYILFGCMRINTQQLMFVSNSQSIINCVQSINCFGFTLVKRLVRWSCRLVALAIIVV